MNSFVGSRVFYALLAALLLVGFSFLVSRPDYLSRLPSKKDSGGKIATENISLENLVNKDSDKDGVFDWEESLWGTDPLNPDTYGRNLGDKAEIDNLRSASGGGNLSPGGGLAELNDTDIFAQQIFSSLLALRQSGNLTNSAMDSISSSITENIFSQSGEIKHYTLSDIKVVITSTSTVLKYRDGVSAIARKYANSGLGDELLVIARAVDEKNLGLLKNIGVKADVYEKILKESLVLAIPSDLAQNHLSMVNSYRNISESLRQLEKIWSDPIAGLVEITRYRNATSNLLLSLGNVESYFTPRDTINGNIAP